MNATHRNPSAFLRGAALLGAGLALPLTFNACSGGSGSDPENRGAFKLALASTGLGQVYPYRIRELDAFGVPTNKVIDIVRIEDLKNNLTATNSVLPQATFLTTATLPEGGAGNQFLLLRFTHVVDIDSVLSSTSTQNSGLTGAIQVLAYDPATEAQTFVKGRAFVGGFTYVDDPTTPTLDLTLVQALQDDGNGNIESLGPPWNTGARPWRDFPGADNPAGFSGEGDLVRPHSFVFVPDADGDLSTFETFPTGKVIRILVTSSVRDYRNKPLVEEVCTGTTVGADTLQPNVLGYTSMVQISPGNGQTGVDPTTTIQVNFSKPVQPREVGEFFDPQQLTPPLRGVTLNVTIANNTIPVLYYADPLSASDLCNYTLRPAFFFPGQVNVAVSVNNTIHGTAGNLLQNTVTTTFETGDGPGIVNAPVAPDAIYVGRVGINAGVSVIDFNGFGQGTGDIGDTYPSRFLLNPNLGQPGLNPPLAPGTTNMDAGGAGALTLTRDTNLSDLLIDGSVVSGVDDIHIGQPLDKVFNNENINPNATRANQVNPVAAQVWGNTITQAPHPNPPRLVFPPPNPAQQIFGEEPTQTSSVGPIPPPPVLVAVPPCQASPRNILVTGDPLSNNKREIGQFPRFFGSVGVFYGPQPPPGTPQPPTPFCPYTSRQQVGHFLYVLDRAKKQVLVVNSNRMTVLETFRLSDPFSMTLSPNLKRLGVTNFSAGTVTFIDTDPQSLSFHQVVTETRVGRGPTGIAWQPEGEDVLVLNSIDNSMSILKGTDLKVRKTVIGHVNAPIEIAVTNRNLASFATGLWFAYILNKNGAVAIFESGPDGVNGIGFDDTIGVPEQGRFGTGARKVAPDVQAQNSAVYVAHTDSSGFGQVSHLELTSSPVGPQPIFQIQGGFILPPTFRQREWTVNARIGGRGATTLRRDFLSGNSPVDIAFNNNNNNGYLADATSNQVSNLVYAEHSGKGLSKAGLVFAYLPTMLIVGYSDSGTVDVLELDTGKIIRTLKVPGVRVLSHYWRQ